MEEIWQKCFAFLSFRELPNVSLVCMTWLHNSQYQWKMWCFQKFPSQTSIFFEHPQISHLVDWRGVFISLSSPIVNLVPDFQQINANMIFEDCQIIDHALCCTIVWSVVLFHRIESMSILEFSPPDDSNLVQAPLDELSFWKGVWVSTQELFHKLKLPQIRDNLRVLKMMDYDVSYKFEQAKSIYCKVFSEAKTNSRYLQTVQQPLESLISGTLRDISITFPSLINTLRSIFHYNMYFRSEKRILGFLSRISSALHTRICIHLSNAMNSLVCCMRDSTWSLIDIENNLSAFTGVECRFSCKLKTQDQDSQAVRIPFRRLNYIFQTFKLFHDFSHKYPELVCGIEQHHRDILQLYKDVLDEQLFLNEFASILHIVSIWHNALNEFIKRRFALHVFFSEYLEFVKSVYRLATRSSLCILETYILGFAYRALHPQLKHSHSIHQEPDNHFFPDFNEEKSSVVVHLESYFQLFTRNQHQMDVHTSAYDLPFSRYTKSLSLRSQQLIFVRPVTDLEYSHESTSYNEFLELASACSHEIDQLFHKLDTKWEYLQAVVKTCA